ncbi:type 1 glutamine amidotransferase domain-containing protein [Priestia megaterium]|uniref:type 1 glutamine amidotransferase domain-containing protein n=1 Tax=Priestia megaterium TaxID=1404 RepID=UPI003D086708
MSKKTLIVVTNQDQYEATKEPTGLWLGELVHFYDKFKNAGINMDIASIKGGNIPLDPSSISGMLFDKISKQYHSDAAFMKELNNSKKLSDVNSDDYNVIYFTGGHGTMWDFPNSPEIQDISQRIYENGGIVSAVCHGVGALLNIKDSTGQRLIQGKKVTGYSNTEEKLVKAMGKIPFRLEEALKEAGGLYKKSLLPFTSYTRVDGRIISGQNPQSTKEVAEKVLAVLGKIQ